MTRLESANQPAIAFSHVGKRFEGDGSRAAIADLDFRVEVGEHVCVVGRTGCGKSTSVNLMLGLMTASEGQVRVLGIDPYRDFQQLRGRIGCVFQSDRLLPWRSAIENVLMPLEILRTRDEQTEEQAVQLLARVGLAGYEDVYPQRLSGGMRQRVAFARALITRPEVLIADEAFGHLDEVTAVALRDDFHRIAKSLGQTIYQITHSLDEALALADRILVFDRPGRVAGEFVRAAWTGGSHARDTVLQALRTLIAGRAVAGTALGEAA